MPTDGRGPPLMVLGLDAGDPDLIRRWAGLGYLPTISSILDRGCWGRTAGPELLSEHGVWTSLFSGISRGQTGYYSFRQLRPGTYDLQTVTGYDLDARPFWSYLRGGDRNVAVVDAPEFELVPGLLGVQLKNWAAHHTWAPDHPIFGTATEPPGLLRELRRVVGSPIRVDEKLNSSPRADRRIYRRLLERIDQKGSVCRYLLAGGHFDLVVVNFTETHLAGHQFWTYDLDGPVAEGGPGVSELSHGIRDVYQAIDRQMGFLLAELLSDANVFLVSSVGMEDRFPTTGLSEEFCRRLGYQAAPGLAPSTSSPLGIVRRTMPEDWRIALSRHLPREVRERLLADQFRSGSNWRKTTAFATPSIYSGFLHVNLRGREPEGIVEAGPQYDGLLERLEADLGQLVDPETDQRAVDEVSRTGALFGSSPPVGLPDLFVHWKPGSYMQRVVHPHGELVQRRDYYRRSDHSRNGLIAAAGPSIRARGFVGEISPLDLAPTLLSLLDEPVPRQMSGRISEAILTK